MSVSPDVSSNPDDNLEENFNFASSNIQLVQLPETLEFEDKIIYGIDKEELLKENAFKICSCDFGEDKDKSINCCENCQSLRNCLFFEQAIEVSNSLKDESTHWFNNVNYKSQQLIKNCWMNDIDFNKDIFCEIELPPLPLDQKKSNAESFSETDDLFLEDLESIPVVSNFDFNSLPDEIKLNVFSFFTQRELCRYIAPVCRSWFQLAKDSHLWQVILHNDFKDVTSDLFKQVLISWCGTAIKVEFNIRDDLSKEDFEEIFCVCNNIQDISFAFCSQINQEILSIVCKYCKNLRAINLEGCNIHDETFYKFVGLPLQAIGLSHCTHVTDEGGIFIANNFENLCHINFDGIQWITNEFVETLVQLHSQTLKYIYLDGENLSDRSVELLSTCANLKTLSFSFCTSMTHNALLSISQCKKLTHLKLRKGEQFTNDALLQFFQNIDPDQGMNFRFLNLAECTEISDECLYLIAERCPNLEELDLSWCWEVSDDGLQFIIDQCSHLKKLHLQGLHELFGIPFVVIPKRLPLLRLMDLSQCNKVSDELIENLVHRMKDLTVYNYYGEEVFNSHRYRSNNVVPSDNDSCSNSDSLT